MKIEQWDIDRPIPFHNNSRVHDERNLKAISASVDRFDWLQPLVVDKNGVLIMGHGRLEAAKQLGIEQVPVLVADWLTENEVAAAREADNMTQDLSFFDRELLVKNLEDIDWLDCDMEQFGFYIDKKIEENPYNSEVNGLIYEPTGEDVSIFDLCDTSKADELREVIRNSDLPQEEKQFLELAAMRHVVFDYGKIANYYANASQEMQELMEQSALVIVDFDKAIENGYVKMRTAFDEELGDVI